MTQPSTKKPAAAPDPNAKPEQPAELSAKDLDKVSGGLHFTKAVDKASPKLIG